MLFWWGKPVIWYIGVQELTTILSVTRHKQRAFPAQCLYIRFKKIKTWRNSYIKTSNYTSTYKVIAQILKSFYQNSRIGIIKILWLEGFQACMALHYCFLKSPTCRALLHPAYLLILKIFTNFLIHYIANDYRRIVNKLCCF